MTFAEICAWFNARRSARGRAMAQCPAHPDRSPSLSILEDQHGRLRIHCFAGCTFEQVLRAARLTPRDLFPTRKPLSAAERIRIRQELRRRQAYEREQAQREREAGDLERLAAKCGDRLLERLVRLPSGAEAEEIARQWNLRLTVEREAKSSWENLRAQHRDRKNESPRESRAS
jgi:hypothetical protein